MSRKILIAVGLFLGVFSAKGQVNIAAARAQAVGQTVTIKGVVTNGAELGNIRYIQDATGALPAFGSLLSGVLRGDSISATGVLFDFNGLLELSPTTSFLDLGNGTLPAPLNVPITGLAEGVEAQLLQIDNVSFAVTGNFVGNTNYVISDGVNSTAVRVSNGSNIVGTPIPTGQVSVRGLLSQFNTFQLLARDLGDIFPYLAPAKEINIKIGGTSFLNNSDFTIGQNLTTTLTIENLGSGNLTVSSASFSGVNSADYSTTFTNAVIGSNLSTTLNVQFAAGGIGSRLSTITINSDDVDEPAYVIDLYGIGPDGLATQPSANPTSLVFSNIKAYTFNGAYTQSPATESYLVLWSNGAPVAGSPVDGVSYKRGDQIGNAKVAYVGPNATFVPRHIIANQNYHLSIISFNGPAGFENYRTITPLIGNTTTTGNASGSYYASIDKNVPTFLTSLAALTNAHTTISYGNYKPTVMNQFEVRDTTNGQSYIVCAYSGERKVFNDPFDWTPTGYSREHTYAHSWMPTFPADGDIGAGIPAKPEYSDQHNLFPTNLANANSPRSNLPLGEITGSVVFTYLGGSVGNGPSGQLLYEPREEHKGNAARSIFYMATAYSGINGNNWQIPTNQPQDILKEWHELDPADNYEIARNEYIFSLQNNRNPYVDSADYVCFVNFQNMTYDASTCGLGINDELLDANYSVFPVPASSTMYLQVNGTEINGYKIVNQLGATVLEMNGINEKFIQLSIENLSPGVYFTEVITPFGIARRAVTID